MLFVSLLYTQVSQGTYWKKKKTF